jgi:hypothetical protein
MSKEELLENALKELDFMLQEEIDDFDNTLFAFRMSNPTLQEYEHFVDELCEDFRSYVCEHTGYTYVLELMKGRN